MPPNTRFQLPANGLQRAATAIAIIGLGTPAYWLALRFATKTGGWITFIYLLFASWIVLASQIACLLPTIMRTRRTSPAAGGPTSTPLMLTAIIVHLISALFIGDYGDSADQTVAPWVTRAVGLPDNAATAIFALLVLAWLGLQITAIIFAMRESSLESLEKSAQQQVRGVPVSC